jgi:hypothetical protein
VRYAVRHLILFAFVGWTSACAETSPCPAGQVLVEGRCVDENSKFIPIVCRNSVNEETSVLSWELTVEPSTIESGEVFSATLDGVVLFHEEFLDDVQTEPLIEVSEVNLIELKATVQVRSGATGEPRILTNEDEPYECFLSPRASCDPANDDISSGPPGGRSNSDCQPESPQNPCGRFIRLPTSSECGPGGLCAALGKTSQCFTHEFCVTGDLPIELKRAIGEYTAQTEGRVLFGWADETLGASIDQMPVAADEAGPLSLRLGIGSLLVAFECAMPRETPDGALVSFPIETP